MFSKNNRQMFRKKTENRKLRYSIKKLSIGVASVLVGIYIGFGGAESGNAQVVNDSENHLGSSEVMNGSMENPVIVDGETDKLALNLESDESVTAEAPVSNPKSDESATAEAPVSNSESDESATAEAPVSNPESDESATAEAPVSNSESDESATAEAPVSNLESDETTTAGETVANSVINETAAEDLSTETRNATEAPINIDAIESGKVKTGGQLTNEANIISGWLELAPKSAVGYTPGTGASTKLNGYTVNAQWIDTDGAVSPVYTAVTHNLPGGDTNGGGDGVFAFELPTWTDETGVEHRFTYIPTSKQRLKLWLAPKQLSPDGNELITFRPVVGNTPGFSTPTTAGAFYLAGANLQRASIYVVELPSKENLDTFVGKEDTWIYDDKGPDSNPSNIVGGTNRVSGKVWWETSKNGVTFPTSTGENFVTQTADEAKTGFRVVTSILTPEGKAALESTQTANNAYDIVKEQLAILKAHPEYVQETVVAPIIDGEYTAHFTNNIDVGAMYQFVVNGEGEIQLAYSNFPVLAYGSPREYTHSNPFIAAGRQQVYNSHFALVPNLDKSNIDITNYDTTEKVALPGNTAVSDVQTIFNVGSTVEIVWSNKDGEISRTSVSTIEEAEKAAIFTVPSDIKENTIYTVELVVNGVTVDADSFLARLAKEADKYEPKVEPVEKPYGEATTEKDVTDAVTVPNYPKDGDQPVVTVDPGAKLPDGKTPGTVEVPVTVTYPDGSKDQVKVPVTTLEKVIDRTDDPSQPTPAGYVRVTFEAGEGSFAADAKTVFDVKAGTAAAEVPTPTVTAPTGKVQTGWNPELPASYDKAGTYTAQFKAKTTEADKYEPKVEPVEKPYGEATTEKDVTDAVTVPNYPKDGDQPVVTVDPGAKLPDGKTPGTVEVPVTVTYPDGSKDQVKVPVTTLEKVIDRTDDPSQPTPAGYVRVTFEAGEGSFAADAKTVFDVKAGTAAAEVPTPTVTAPTGKVQTGWNPELPASYDKAGTYTAQFKAKTTEADKYEPKVEPVEKPYGEATTEKDVTDAVTVPNYPKDGDQPVVTVDPGAKLPDGKTPGTVEVPVTVTYPDGSKDQVKVPVTTLEKVIDRTDDPSQPTPAGYVRVTFEAGEGSFAADAKTVFDVKAGTAAAEVPTPTVTAPTGKVQTGWNPELPASYDKAGTYTAQFKAKTTEADKYEPKVEPVEKPYGEATTEKDVTDAVTVPNYPKDGDQPVVTVDPGAKLPDGKTPGTVEVPVTVTYPDGSKDQVKVPVTTLEKVIDRTDDPSQPTPAGYVRVTFEAGEGSFAADAKTVFDVKAGTAAAEVPTPTVTAPTGKVQTGWNPELPASYDKAGTYTAQFKAKTTEADKYEPKVEPVEKPYGEATTEKDVTDAVTVPNYPKDGDQPVVTVDPGAKLPDGKTPGTVEVPVTVTYPDGSKDQVKVPVTTLEKVIDRTDDPSQPTPAGYVRVTFEAGEGSFAADAKTVFDVKAGTAAAEVPTPTVTAPTGKVQTGWNPELPASYDKAGTYTAQFKAKTTEADKYEPKVEPVEKPYGEATTEKDVTDAVTVPNYPKDGDQPVVTVDPGAKLPDGKTPGTVEVPVTVTYPDGSKDQVKVPVTTLEKVIDRTDDPSQPTPAGYVRVTFEAGEGSFAADAKTVFDVKAGTAAAEVPTPTVTAPTGKVQTGWNPELPASYDKAGTYTAQFKAKTTEADKYEPKVIGEKVEVGEKVDLTDNVTNLPELPKGTKVTDITPDGEIDTSTPGKYQGTIEVTYPDGSKDRVKVPVEVVDTVAPDKPKVDPIKPGDTEVTGKTEPNIDVTVKLPNGSEYSGSSDDQGIFKVKVPSLEAGDKVIVTVTDKSGNTSEPTVAIVSSENAENVISGDNNKSNATPQQKLESGIGLSSTVLTELPKTGESTSNKFVVTGGVVLMSMFGLLGYKKRKENE
ncbi:Rib/alpha-like domain-containing protein [Enterococcus sp. AN402]|uniref:Rib/alpha-like domain-containing protein n=1 Tax=Enterococcus sp. AN402 TaxID=3151386 RepID=UPI003457B105